LVCAFSIKFPERRGSLSETNLHALQASRETYARASVTQASCPPQDEFAVANVYVSAACRDRESWGPNYETIFLQKALGWKKLYSKVRDRAAFAKATAPKEDALASTRAARTQAGRLFAPRKRVS
jgi:hypothetical protein